MAAGGASPAVVAAAAEAAGGKMMGMKLDDKQGSIEVGKRADLVVLNRNLFDLDPYEISDAYVTMTIFDGQTIYQRNE